MQPSTKRMKQLVTTRVALAKLRTELVAAKTARSKKEAELEKAAELEEVIYQKVHLLEHRYRAQCERLFDK